MLCVLCLMDIKCIVPKVKSNTLKGIYDFLICQGETICFKSTIEFSEKNGIYWMCEQLNHKRTHGTMSIAKKTEHKSMTLCLFWFVPLTQGVNL